MAPKTRLDLTGSARGHQSPAVITPALAPNSPGAGHLVAARVLGPAAR